MINNLSRNSQTIEFVFGQIIRQARYFRMHLRTAQALFIGDLAGRHLDKWWATQEYFRLIFDHDDIVGHTGQIGSARSGISKNHRDAGNSGFRAARDLFESGASRYEDFMLDR